MARIAMVAYRPRKGEGIELIGMIRSHFPALRVNGFITDRKVVGMKAKDGAVMVVFEWVSEDSITEAETDPVIQEMWMDVSKVSDFDGGVHVKESNEVFPTFEVIEIE